MIEIVPYAPELLPGIASVFHDSVRYVPHQYPVPLETLASVLEPVRTGERNGSPLREEAAFVARDGGRTLGFLHAGLGLARHSTTDEYGILRFLGYERGRRDAGQALLDAGEAHLRAFPIDRIATFDSHHKYPFYQIESSYLSERIDHVQALLGRNGYRPLKGEVILEWPGFVPPAPAPVGFETTVTTLTERASLPTVKVQAWRGGEEAGICVIESVGQNTADPHAQEWALTSWLGIQAPWQGKGLGKALLGLGLSEARNLGYRHALIGPDWRNDRAFVFYSNYGYRLSDWTYIHGKDLRR